MIQVKDNSPVENLPNWADDLINVQMSELSDKILVFPPSVKQSEDLSENQMIFTQMNHQIRTTNLMGWLGKNDESITIHSRFDDGKEDFFLRYMIETVFDANIVNFDLSKGLDGTFALLPYLFPLYLENALRKGIYKTYAKKQYNDIRLKGPIDIARHIKQNLPFIGKIAYNTRELTTDNHVTQVIRHTIEFLKLNDKVIIPPKFVKLITENTLTYQMMDRQKVIHSNLTIKNPYFYEYRDLIKLCLLILQGEKTNFGEEKEKIHGILFDGAWLWEEYIHKILPDFEHPKGNESLYLTGNAGQVRPDFFNDNMIIDTKYKHVEKKINREDRFQIISYLHYRETQSAGLLFPYLETKYEVEGTLKGLGGEIFKLSLAVPQSEKSYQEFKDLIKIEEKKLINELEKGKND